MARLQTGARRRRPHEGEPVSRLGSRGRAPHPEGRAAERSSRDCRMLERPATRAGVVGRPRQADVRSAGARAAGRHHARHHVPAGARSEHAHLSADRRARAAPPDVAPQRTIRRSSRSWPRSTRYHVSLFAYFLEKLQATPDGDGSLLDHSIYLLGSGMGNPDVHNHTNLPIVLAGGRAGKLKGARHIKYAAADAAGESPPDAARQGRRPSGELRRQQRQGRESGTARRLRTASMTKP